MQTLSHQKLLMLPKRLRKVSNDTKKELLYLDVQKH